MSYLKMDDKTYKRALQATTHVKIIFNKTAPRYRKRLAGIREEVFRFLGDMRDYIKANAGVNPPSDALLEIKHNDYTITRLNKMDEGVKTIYVLLNEGNQREFKKQYQAVNNLLDEFRGYLIEQKTRNTVYNRLEVKNG